MENKKVLVTGAAGFIGYHLASSLVNSGTTVVGLDNMDPYYDVNLKLGRLEKLGVSPKEKGLQRLVLSMKYPGFRFMQADICDHSTLETLFATERFSHVCHLP